MLNPWAQTTQCTCCKHTPFQLKSNLFNYLFSANSNLIYCKWNVGIKYILAFNVHLSFHTGLFSGLNQINWFLNSKKDTCCVNIRGLHLDGYIWTYRVNCTSNRALLKKHPVSSMLTKYYSTNSFESQFHIHPTALKTTAFMYGLLNTSHASPQQPK